MGFWGIFFFITAIVSSIVITIKKKTISIKAFKPKYDGLYFEATTRKKIVIYYGIRTDTKSTIIFYRESFFEKVLKFIGICREFQVGIPEFDKNIFIVSDDYENVKNLNCEKELLASIYELLNIKKSNQSAESGKYFSNDLKVKSISILNNLVFVKIVGTIDGVFHSGKAAYIKKLLFKIEKLFKSQDSIQTTKNYNRFLIGHGLLIGFGVGSLLIYFFYMNINNVLILSYSHIQILTIIAILSYLFLNILYALVYCRRSSYFSILLKQVLLIGIFLAGFCFFSLIQRGNVELDRADGVLKNGYIVDKEVHSTRYDHHYTITVDFSGSDSSLGEKEIRVDYEIFAYVKLNEYINIYQYPGFFKDPWLRVPPRRYLRD